MAGLARNDSGAATVYGSASANAAIMMATAESWLLLCCCSIGNNEHCSCRESCAAAASLQLLCQHSEKNKKGGVGITAWSTRKGRLGAMNCLIYCKFISKPNGTGIQSVHDVGYEPGLQFILEIDETFNVIQPLIPKIISVSLSQCRITADHDIRAPPGQTFPPKFPGSAAHVTAGSFSLPGRRIRRRVRLTAGCAAVARTESPLDAA